MCADVLRMKERGGATSCKNCFFKRTLPTGSIERQLTSILPLRVDLIRFTGLYGMTMGGTLMVQRTPSTMANEYHRGYLYPPSCKVGLPAPFTWDADTDYRSLVRAPGRLATHH